MPIGGGPLEAVVIGASAGGPSAIETVLCGLPAAFPAPIAVCQHMIQGATEPWAKRLDSVCPLAVTEARDCERFEAGRVYVAPTGTHMLIRGTPDAPRVSLMPDFADAMHVPSIDFLMNSAAVVFGHRMVAALLTGMGSDGAMGLLSVRRCGGVTLAQSEDTAFMPSMPRTAAELGAVSEVVPLERMASVLAERVAGRL